MKQPPAVIFAEETRLRVTRGDSTLDIPLESDAQLEKIASEIAAMLGSSASAASLSIPASWCLSATVSLAGVPARNRRNSLLYRLELLLPLTAEEIAADYIFNEPDTAFAICVAIPRIKPITDALEGAGIAIESIFPGTIHAVQSMLASSTAKKVDAVIWQVNDSVEIAVIRKETIVGWYIFPAQASDLSWHMAQIFAAQILPYRVITCSLNVELMDLLKKDSTLELVAVEQRSIEKAITSADFAAIPHALNLRRDGLAPGNMLSRFKRPLAEAAFAALILVACICGVACWRGNRLEQIASSYRNQQAVFFRSVFPGHAVPANILSRLKSEDRALTAGGSDAGAALSPSALPTLQSILTAIDALPPAARFEVDDLKIQDTTFSLQGMVRNRNDLADVTGAIQASNQLQLAPPQTEQVTGQGLRITLTGSQTTALAGDQKTK